MMRGHTLTAQSLTEPGATVRVLVRRQSPHEPAALTDAQQAVVAACTQTRSSICVLGGPGTGKTTALVAAVVAQVRGGVPLSRIVVLTNSRPAAQRLRTRIVAALGTTQRGLQVTTVHGWCQQVLQRFAGAQGCVPRLLSAPEQEFRVRELLAGFDRTQWPEQLWPAVGTRGFAREVRAVLARTRQLGLDPGELAAAGVGAGRAEWVAVARFFNEYLDVLDAEGVVDYVELVHRARLLLQDQDVRLRVPEFASMIFCDEFADLDRGMINVLVDAHRAGSSVVAVADPDTSVFGFRGADPRAVSDFADRFDRPGAPAVTVRLDENLRSVPAVVDALRGVARRLPHRGVDHAAPQGLGIGSTAVRAELVADGPSLARRIAEVLRHAHLVQGVAWAQMAVITRSGHNAVTSLAARLAAAGVPVRVAGDEVALSGESAVRHLLTVLDVAVRLAEGRGLDERQAARLLGTPLGGLDALGLRRLGRALRHLAKAHDPQQAPAGSEFLIARELAGAVLVPDDPAAGPLAAVGGPTEMGVAELSGLVQLRKLLTELVRLVNHRQDVATLLWHAWSGTRWPRLLQATALGCGENSARAHRDLDAVVALFDLAESAPSWAGAQGVRSLVAEVGGQQIPADTARENDPRRSGVSVLTVHRAKGEQWQLVVLAGLQEGQWPTLQEPSGLLRADLLAADGLQAPPSPRDILAAERRALLLAASRASEQLVALAIDDQVGEADPPSRFLREFGVEAHPTAETDLPATLNGLVAQLRRVTGNPAASPELRAQAAAELAWLAAQADDDGRGLVSGADPSSWWGLREFSRAQRPVAPAERPIRLSGSEIQQLLNCPRKWLLANRARGRQPWGSAATFGTLVHAVVAEATSRGIRATDLLAKVDELWPKLAFEAEWLSMVEREAVEEALKRFDRWADSPDHRHVLGVEVGFEVAVRVDGHEIVMVGTVDRLEVDDLNRLRVIDFKTDRTPATAIEAAAMDQLGFYQLAARMGAFDQLSGGLRELADAEVVFLRAESAHGPVVRRQPSLDIRPRLDDQPVPPGRTWVHDRLSRAAGIIRSEDFYANLHPGCRTCVFRLGCPAQLFGGEQ